MSFTETRLDHLFSEVKELIPLERTELLTPSVVHGIVPQASLGMKLQQALRDGYSVSPAQPGDFVISLSSHAYGIEYCGISGGISPDYTLLRPKCDKRIIPYLKYALKSSWIIQQLGVFKTGVRMGLRLTWNKVRYCKIDVPAPEVAEVLATFLDRETGRIDGLIEKKTQFIELLKEKRAAVITHAVTKGFDPDAPTKDSGEAWIGEIPVHWEVKPLRAFFNFRNEKNDPVKTENILSLSIAHGVTPYTEEGRGGNKSKDDLTAYKIAHEGDIVLNSMNVIVGAVGRSKYYGAISPVYYALYPKNDDVYVPFFEKIFMNSGFQKGLLRFGKGILMKISGTGQMNTIRMKISQDDLRTVRFPVPPHEEQVEIARALLQNGVLRREGPFPRKVQATRTISAVPRALKRFMRATRMWISAVWR
ncbi:MAG: hypothetical protein ACU0AY_16230, partial [Marinibacterium profundimaris]